MRQIICVHVGNKYSQEYVDKLERGCKRASDQPYRFTVINEKNLQPIPTLRPDRLWWYKMQAFRPDLVEDENLLLDLDLVIIKELDRLWNWEKGKFIICQDFNRHWVPSYKHSNSSVVRFTREQAAEIWGMWSNDWQQSIISLRGDQDWMDAKIVDKTWWPASWIQSWKWEVYRNGQKAQHSAHYYSLTTELDPECSIIAFHGKPDPHEVDESIIHQHWQ